MGIMVELTISKLPDTVNIEEHDERLLSTLSIMRHKASILGFVVPMGRPKSEKGMDPS